MESRRQVRCRDTANETRGQHVNCSKEFVANPLVRNSRGLLLPDRDGRIEAKEADVVLDRI